MRAVDFDSGRAIYGCLSRRLERSGRMCGRADYLTFSRSERSERAVAVSREGRIHGRIPNVLNVQDVRSKFFEKKCVLRIDVRKIRRYISGGEE